MPRSETNRTRTRAFRRAVVTGGAGFLGSHLCDALLQADVAVVCVDNLSTGSVDNISHLLDRRGFELAQADTTDALIVGGTVDLVLHLASPASPADYARLPIDTLRAGSHGTYNALCLARGKGARFVLASISKVYGDPLEHPQSESYWGNVNPVGPRSVYDEAKRFAEALTIAFARHGPVDAGIVRIFNTYGPRLRAGDGRAVATFIRQALLGEPLTIHGDGTQTRSLCFVDDSVRGILALATSLYCGPVNIGNPEEITILELAERILRLTGSTSPWRTWVFPPTTPGAAAPTACSPAVCWAGNPACPSRRGCASRSTGSPRPSAAPRTAPPGASDAAGRHHVRAAAARVHPRRHRCPAARVRDEQVTRTYAQLRAADARSDGRRDRPHPPAGPRHPGERNFLGEAMRRALRYPEFV